MSWPDEKLLHWHACVCKSYFNETCYKTTTLTITNREWATLMLVSVSGRYFFPILVLENAPVQWPPYLIRLFFFLTTASCAPVSQCFCAFLLQFSVSFPSWLVYLSLSMMSEVWSILTAPKSRALWRVVAQLTECDKNVYLKTFCLIQKGKEYKYIVCSTVTARIIPNWLGIRVVKTKCFLCSDCWGSGHCTQKIMKYVQHIISASYLLFLPLHESTVQ